jgi:hypothetical protein
LGLLLCLEGPSPEEKLIQLAPRDPWLNGHVTGTDLLEVPTIYKTDFSGLCKGISPENMARNMVRLRTSICWIQEFPLNGYSIWKKIEIMDVNHDWTNK